MIYIMTTTQKISDTLCIGQSERRKQRQWINAMDLFSALYPNVTLIVYGTVVKRCKVILASGSED